MLWFCDSRGDGEVFLSFPLFQGGEGRWRAGWSQGSQEKLQWQLQWGRRGVWHVVCAGMLFYVRLHQAASDVPVDWSFRRSVSQLFSNSDSSPKVHFKMQEFLLLSFSKRASAASLLSTIKITAPVIIIKHVLPIEFLNDFCPQWVYDLSILEPLCF